MSSSFSRPSPPATAIRRAPVIGVYAYYVFKKQMLLCNKRARDLRIPGRFLSHACGLQRFPSLLTVGDPTGISELNHTNIIALSFDPEVRIGRGCRALANVGIGTLARSLRYFFGP